MNPAVCPFGWLLLFTIGVTGSLYADPQPHRTGKFTLSLTERSPYSSLETFQDRGYDFESKDDYKVEEEVANVSVPSSYTKGRPVGLIVWISASDGGGIPGSFQKNLDEYGFMMVSVKKTGNKHSLFRRYGLALDAYHNVNNLYTIDPERVVIAGNSGGGRSASGISLVFPDVFAGGAYYVIGVNYWDRIDLPGNKFYSGFMESKPERLEEAKSLRFVFHTGSKDFNREGTERVYKSYLKDGFEHCLYLEDEGLGHSMPGRESIAKGLAFLNEGLPEKGKKALEEGIARAHAGRFDSSWKLFQKADVYGNPDASTWIGKMETAIEKEISEIMGAEEEVGVLKQHQALRGVVEKYGQDAAQDAVVKLEELEEDPDFEREREAADILLKIQQGHSAAGVEQTVGYLQRLVEEYPETSAASEAADYLEKFQTDP